jgi:transposase
MRISGCRLKEKTQDRLAEFFVTARSAADLAGVNRKAAAYFFHRLRQITATQLEDSLPVDGLVEVDESYFGGVRKGKRGRGAAGKVPVFGWPASIHVKWSMAGVTASIEGVSPAMVRLSPCVSEIVSPDAPLVA